MYKSFDIGSLLGNVNSENNELNLEQGAVFKRNKQTQKISKIDMDIFRKMREGHNDHNNSNEENPISENENNENQTTDMENASQIFNNLLEQYHLKITEYEELYQEYSETLKENTKPVSCAADHGSTTPCCGQSDTGSVSTEFQCPQHMPKCSGYIFNRQWGTCKVDGDSAQHSKSRQLQQQLDQKNEELISLTKQMHNQIEIIVENDSTMRQHLNSKQTQLQNTLQTLSMDKSNLENSSNVRGMSVQTLDGVLEDSERKLTGYHYYYLAWFIASTTLIGITVYQISKSKK